VRLTKSASFPGYDDPDPAFDRMRENPAAVFLYPDLMPAGPGSASFAVLSGNDMKNRSGFFKK
jgi:hypothetical protein